MSISLFNLFILMTSEKNYELWLESAEGNNLLFPFFRTPK